MKSLMVAKQRDPVDRLRDRVTSLWATSWTDVVAHIDSGDELDAIVIDPAEFEGDTFELLELLKRTAPEIAALVAVDPTDRELASRFDALGVTDIVARPVDWGFLGMRLPYLLRLREERLEALGGMHFVSSHDALTGLPNRTGLHETLERTLETARRSGQIVGVLCLDLGGFTRINETVGIAGGDEFLRRIAASLRIQLRRSDLVARIGDGFESSVTSRIGGDEFCIVAPALEDAASPARIARRLIDVASSVVEVSGRKVSCSASVGIAVFPSDTQDPQSLLSHAEAAMRRAKDGARNGFEFYSKALSIAARRQLDIETALRRAVEKGEVRIFYQPKLEIASGHLSGMEALIRWQSPEMGRVSPQELIGAAERTGLIGDIGRWALWEACARNRDWQNKGCRRVPVSVNVSASQLSDPGFKDTVIGALIGTGLEPRYLELEVTEGVLIEDAEATAEILADLRVHGISIALDDFGAGYASLAYLTKYPLDVLKIDRRFIVGMTSNPAIASIVEGVVAMAHGLGLRVVAEGVDDPEQLELLKACGCDQLQGYLASEALSERDFVAFLKREQEGREVWLLEEKSP
jgi:diguanylate cyclase (GGDEF)-like protein